MKFFKFLKQTFAELRKVHWLRFGELMKNTAIVLGVMVFFTLFVAGLDWSIKNVMDLFNL